VILVNLTCGRNPWKRACPADSTFHAFLENPSFLGSILSVSPELESILHRVFESDPLKRISIHELRDRIVACPRLTTKSYAGLPPMATVEADHQVDAFDYTTFALPLSPPRSPCPSPSPNVGSRSSNWSSVEPAMSQESLCSPLSPGPNCSLVADLPEQPGFAPSPFNFYGNLLPLSDPAEKENYGQQTFIPPLIQAF
jgi:hypothetical protein